MKYINAEKLIAEIERRKADAKLYDMSGGDAPIYDELLSIIASLQQEQPERICSRCRHFDKKEDCCNCPYGGMKYSINENGVYKCNSFDEVEQEQPEVDLEKACLNFGDEIGIPVCKNFRRIARHFYELGLNARKEE